MPDLAVVGGIQSPARGILTLLANPFKYLITKPRATVVSTANSTSATILSGSLATVYGSDLAKGTPGATSLPLPTSSLIRATNGMLYGTTNYGGTVAEGGTLGYGTIFGITPTGTFTTVYSFSLADGAVPNSLIQALDRPRGVRIASAVIALFLSWLMLRVWVIERNLLGRESRPRRTIACSNFQRLIHLFHS